MLVDVNKKNVEISISVVSHNQLHLIKNLLHDLNKYCNGSSIELILTLNLEELIPFSVYDFSFPIKVIKNSIPLGFGANHNQAFTKAIGQYFCVINPDIRLNENPFHALVDCFQDSKVALAAPLVIAANGEVEDSARVFPTPFKILAKLFGRDGKGSYVIKSELIYPDWVGGMFMLFPYAIFQKLNGFNERYFLYYEDVDLCARLRLLGYEVGFCPKVNVIHDARRTSHKSLKYFKWHITSMIRFFCSIEFFRISWRKMVGHIN